MQLWWVLTHQAPPESGKSNDKPLQPQPHRDALLRNTFPVWCYLANRESASQCARRTDWNLPDSEFH